MSLILLQLKIRNYIRFVREISIIEKNSLISLFVIIFIPKQKDY
jgi:hypothetical protein